MWIIQGADVGTPKETRTDKSTRAVPGVSRLDRRHKPDKGSYLVIRISVPGQVDIDHHGDLWPLSSSHRACWGRCMMYPDPVSCLRGGLGVRMLGLGKDRLVRSGLVNAESDYGYKI